MENMSIKSIVAFVNICVNSVITTLSGRPFLCVESKNILESSTVRGFGLHLAQYVVLALGTIEVGVRRLPPVAAGVSYQPAKM